VRIALPRTAVRPPELSLLTAALPGLPDDPPRWAEGFEWTPDDCGRIRLLDVCGPARVDLLDNEGPGLLRHDPVTLEAWFTCSTGTSGGSGEWRTTYRDRAVSALEACTPFALERELWDGTLAKAALDAGTAGDTYAENRFLTDGRSDDVTPVPGTPVSPTAAIALLEEAVRGCQCGGRTYLHAGIRAASYLAGKTTRDGNVLTTKLGSVLVPGGGYLTTGPDGTEPPAGSAWVYATGPVRVRTTTPVLPDEADVASTLDRASNTVTVHAQRTGAATWDGCCAFAVLTALKTD